MIEINASDLERLMNCSGSHAAEQLIEFEPPVSDGQAEGTAAHFVVEETFRKSFIPDQAPNGHPVDDDMKYHASDFVARVMSQTARPFVEQRCDFMLTDAITVKVKPDAFYYDQEDALCLDDFKYGWRPVAVQGNWQLIAGAIGAIRRDPEVVPKKVKLGIYQPRARGGNVYNRVTMTIDTLIAKHDEMVAKLSNLDDTLSTGDWCIHCPVARGASCPAFRAASFNAVDVVMRGTSEDPDNATLARELDMFDRAHEVLKQHRQFVEDVAMARIKAKQGVPGWGLERSYGKRVWRKDAFEKVMEDAKAVNPELKEDDFYEPRKPKSPFALEKFKGVTKELTAPHTNTPPGKQKLARISLDIAPPPEAN